MQHSPPFRPLILRSIGTLAGLLWLTACGTPEERPGSLQLAMADTMMPGYILPGYVLPDYTKESSDDDGYDDADASDSGTKDSFEMASVDDTKLSDMRGGFILAGGLKLNFGLTTTTMINGNIVSNLVLNSNKLNGNIPLNLQQLVQVGSGNNFDSPASAAVTTKVLTIVQNSTNGATIANNNVLNLSVSHFNSFNLHNAELSSVGPLVRSLR